LITVCPVVGAAVQQLGHEIGASGCNQHQIGFATQVDVRHVVGFAGVPLRDKHRAVTQCLHGHRGDELRCRLGHDHLHRSALLDQRAAQFRSLVAGDAAAQAQDDVFVEKCTHGAQCSRQNHHSLTCFLIY
jgi:hypothetical protein